MESVELKARPVRGEKRGGFEFDVRPADGHEEKHPWRRRTIFAAAADVNEKGDA
jgi:hypothetical protein